jgi:hypothetical protein
MSYGTAFITFCLGLFLVSGNAVASVTAGGACPTGATYLNTNTNALGTLASIGVTSCFYVSAAGSDSNSGTSESVPWLHAPGMSACTGNCASTTPAAGEGFIFRGGDTWHFGNSSLSPFDGNTACLGTPHWQSCMTWSWSGNSSNPIYIGADPTWYSGSSWARPIFNGDNPTSTSPVSSCTYDDSYTYFFTLSAQYVQVDNIEWTGLCWHGNQENANEGICCSGYISWATGNSTPDHNTISNDYFHGWTHRQNGCSLSGGEPTGDCLGGTAINGANGSAPAQNQYDRVTGVVCDGSDTDGGGGTGFGSFMCVMWNGYQVDNSYFAYTVQGFVGGSCHLWYNDLIENEVESFDQIAHGNSLECQAEWPGSNYYHDIVFRNNNENAEVFFCPNSADFLWNIVSYNNPGEPFNFDPCSGVTQTTVANSTFADDGGLGFQNGVMFKNSLVINTGIINSPVQTNVISMTDAQATAAGFTSASLYQPTSQNCNGQTSPACPIGAGANMTSSWPSGFSTSDATDACAYNTSNHTLSCPARTPNSRPTSGAWDVGAYEFVASGPPDPPTGVSAVAH